ncbi:hypothetical protein AB1Y20_005350 [Prymnesium parvum]|uniref:Mitochondrial import inner membrane translocase subunit TIM50 n=1 Tax=Prymnesium parvum TaxID=97485 RepID=A0AB34J600_PRYPA
MEAPQQPEERRPPPPGTLPPSTREPPPLTDDPTPLAPAKRKPRWSASRKRARSRPSPPAAPLPPPPLPPPPCPRGSRILLILDVNHLLCERQPRDAPRPAHAQLAAHAHTYVPPGRSLVWQRPYAASFVEWCLGRFAVALWTSARRHNARPLVRRLLPPAVLRRLLFTWCQEECAVDVSASAAEGKPLIGKELAAVWRRWPAWGPASTVLVDDDPRKCAGNAPHTALHPAKWHALDTNGETPPELAPGGALRAYLAALAEAADTQAFIRQRPYCSEAPAVEEVL